MLTVLLEVLGGWLLASVCVSACLARWLRSLR